MKKILFVLVSLLVSITAFCQDCKEPEYEMEPYVLNLDSSLGECLPMETAYIKSKASASMFIVGAGKVKTYYYIKGEKSPLTLGFPFKLIINTGDISPKQCISIIKMDNVGSKRRCKIGELGTFTGTTSGEDNSVNFKYKKTGENSVILDLYSLENGEYMLAFTNMMTNTKSLKVYTFSINKPLQKEVGTIFLPGGAEKWEFSNYETKDGKDSYTF